MRMSLDDPIKEDHTNFELLAWQYLLLHLTYIHHIICNPTV